MKHTTRLARANPDLTLPEMHKLTTDQQNLNELVSAALVVVSHLDTVAVPPEMQEARDRLRRAIPPVSLAPKKGRNDDVSD
jgi:hypothetical protein